MFMLTAVYSDAQVHCVYLACQAIDAIGEASGIRQDMASSASASLHRPAVVNYS
jgi:hypothetical protein